jgi:putative ABC transport system permease protein
MPWHDVRYALRLMRRNPGFTAVSVLSLAFGIGANTAIYSLFYTVMLRQLPVDHPEQLVQLVRDSPDEFHSAGYFGWDKYEHFRDGNHVFSGITGMSFNNISEVQTPGSDVDILIKEKVPGNYFRVLGLRPTIGRLLGPEDVPATGDGNVAVLSWAYWDRRFHRDPAILGQRILCDNAPLTVVGIAPRAYVGPRVGSRTDVWVPVEHDDLSILARLKPGVTLTQAQAEIDVLYQHLPVRRANSRMEVLPAGAGMVRVRDQFGKPLLLLIGVVGLLLLLACINMASMLLARSASRQREIAVRVALGAGRGRLIRQMLTESVLLSAAGAAAGVLLAYFGTGAVVRIMASGRVFERVDIEVHPDLHLILFTAAIALLTGVLFGLAPAWYAFRAAPASELRQTGKGGDTWFWRLFGKGLVSAQVGLSILLVTAAFVFLGHLSRLRNFDLGFRSDHVLLMNVDPSHSGYKRDQLAAPYQELLARLQSLAGVRSASITTCTPMQGCGLGSRYLIAEGDTERREDRLFTGVVFVSPRFFETLGVPLVAGRDFTFRDVGHARVAILSQMAARHYFPDVNPVGKHVTVDREPRSGPMGGWFGDDSAYEIIGVAGDTKTFDVHDAANPAIYFNMFQENRIFNQFEVRTAGDSAALAGPVRRIVRDVLKTVPVTRVTTLADQVDSNLVPERLVGTLSEFFGILAAVLAGIGLYGLLAYTVARRTNEIGVRIALGATAGDVSRLVIRDACGMIGSGLALGAVLVYWSRPLATSLIHDLKPESIAPLLAGSAAICAVGLLAAYAPARRAARVDPMEALRRE